MNHAPPHLYECLHGRQKSTLALADDLTAMNAERFRAECNAECITHKFGIPFALAVKTRRLGVHTQNARLLAGEAGRRRTILTRDLLAGLARVGGQTDRAVVGHGCVLLDTAGQRQFF